MTFTLLDLFYAAFAGAGIGFLSGMFGLGGGFLVVPVLNIVFAGIPMEIAVGAGASQVLGPATTSLLARRVDRRHFRFPLTIMGGLLIGSYTGVLAIGWARKYGTVELFGRTVVFIDIAVLTVYLALLLSIGVFVIWESSQASSLSARRIEGLLSGWHVPPCVHMAEFPDRQISITVLAWFGLAVGFLAGFLGMSGGLILLPGLVYLLGMRTQQAVTSSLVIVWLIALLNTAVHAWHGNINLSLVMFLLMGGTVGARIGSEVGVKWGGQKLRKRFGWLLLFTAGLIGWKLFRVFS
ncbi:MAG: sulfite exporter TauE/SafE family protein [Planctomycetaceae bacterium]